MPAPVDTTVAVLNLYDHVQGSWHQVTFDGEVRVDGNIVGPGHEFYNRVCDLVSSWGDHYVGMVSKERVA